LRRKGEIMKLSPYRLKMVDYDVRNVIRFARYVITILPDEKFRVDENPNYKLGIIAVIGQTEKFEKVVLLEVGIGPSRPYHPSEKVYSKRRKWFWLTEKQYNLIAPALFELVAVITKEQVAKRKNAFFSFSFTKRKYTYRKKGFTSYEKRKQFPQGSCFSVNLSDSFVANDICYAELHINKQVHKEIYGLGRLIDKRVNWYSPSRYKGKRTFKTLKVREDLILLTKRLPRHLKQHLVSFFPNGKSTMFYFHILNLLQVFGDDLCQEIQIADQALPKPKNRLRNIQLKTTRKHKDQNIVVFEVFPQEMDMSNNESF